MRKPTPREELYRWHSLALVGARVPMTMSPECGWFAVCTKDHAGERCIGPFYPASIYVVQHVDEDGNLESDETPFCEIAGKSVDLTEGLWLQLASRPISEEEYGALLGQLMSDNYVGPKRPRARWNDPIEIMADMTRYASETL